MQTDYFVPNAVEEMATGTHSGPPTDLPTAFPLLNTPPAGTTTMSHVTDFNQQFVALKDQVFTISESHRHLKHGAEFAALLEDTSDIHSRILWIQNGPLPSDVIVLSYCLIAIIEPGVAAIQAYATAVGFEKQGYSGQTVGASLASLRDAGIQKVEAQIHNENTDSLGCLSAIARKKGWDAKREDYYELTKAGEKRKRPSKEYSLLVLRPLPLTEA